MVWHTLNLSAALRKKCLYSELFWSAFSRSLSQYSVRMRENADQSKSEYGHFSRSAASWFDLEYSSFNIA